MDNLILHYPYHDIFRNLTDNTEPHTATEKTDLGSASPFKDTLDCNDIPIPEIPELTLKIRFHRIAALAREFACFTTSNLTIELKHNYHLLLCIDGDFLIIHDREPLRALVKLLSRCDSFQVIPNGRLFQLLFHYDLRLME